MQTQVCPDPEMFRSGPTGMLYDPGEESWPFKLHLGCGGVYLREYWNVDAVGERAGADVPANIAEVWDYYGRQPGTFDHLPARHSTIVDQVADVTRLPFEAGTVYKILAVQVFEHLTPVQAGATLSDWWRLLVPGGVLVLTVPDLHGTLDWLENGSASQRAFALRHMRGSRRDEWNFHHAWYTQMTLEELLQAHGFRTGVLDNPHVYPALAVRGVKHA